MRGSNKFLTGLIFGAAVGAVTVALTTPKKGSELREELTNKSNDLYNQTRDTYEHKDEYIQKFNNNIDLKLSKVKDAQNLVVDKFEALKPGHTVIDLTDDTVELQTNKKIDLSIEEA